MNKSAFQDVNRGKLVALFNGGDKQCRSLGFELEHILLHKGTHAPALYDEPGGVRDVLERLAPLYDKQSVEGDSLVGLSRPRIALSIEPAAQLEISAGPFAKVTEIEQTYKEFRAELDPILDEFGLEAPMLGYNPSTLVRDLALVPKFRYKCMTEFLGAQSYEGLCMMRGTASLQVSIDFRDETDAMRKLRVAEAIAPILALICDNSPMFEGEKRKFNMVRTAVWAGMKQDRVGTVPGSLGRNFSFADYADYIMTREAILVPDAAAEGGWRYVADKTFDELYADREMTQAELEHALSMVWPDARLKNFIEIRPADAMPIEYCLGYAALVKALFYNDSSLGALDEMLVAVGEDDVRAAKRELVEKGYEAEVYGRSVGSWADVLLGLAAPALKMDEAAYLEPLAALVKERSTLADLWLRSAK